MSRLNVLFAVLCLICAPALVTAQDRSALTPQQMRQAALNAQQTGQTQIALTLTEALLQRDPDDHAALVLRARALRDSGQTAQAARIARHAFSVSQTDAERYLAAVVTAQALASDGRRTQAQLWLRRATEHAPDAQTRRAAIRDLQYVRQRNPLALQLGVSLAPSSNINNGSSTGTTVFFDPFSQQFVEVELLGTALALSGLEASTHAGLRWRFAETPQRATDLSLGWENRSYRLSSDAQRLAPGAKAWDFATTSVYAGLTQRWRSATAREEYSLSGMVGLHRYGGDAYGEFARLGLGLNRALTPRDRLHLDFSTDVTRGPRAPHAEAFRLGLGLTRGMESGGSVIWQAGLGRSRSAVDVADYTELTLAVTHDTGRDILGADLSMGLRLRARDYPATPFAPGARRDRGATAHVSLTFRQAEYYGFNPVVTLRAGRNRSNVGLFTSDQLGIEFGIASAF